MFVTNAPSSSRGFTLIELTIGIVVLSVALLVMTGALFPQAKRSTNPWFQVRSAELAHSMMNEILAKKFDENSFTAANLRCGEDTGRVSSASCITTIQLDNCAGAVFKEEANRADFDDVDDFNCLSLSGNTLTDLTGKQGLATQYSGFNVSVSVSYLNQDLLKLITVTVTPPEGDAIVYSAYKANY